MNDARSWAEGWLTNLVAHGVPNAPGLSRTLLLHGRQWSLLALTEVHEQRRELRRPVVAGVPKNGRYGVVYEQPWRGQDAVWIEVAEYHHGGFGDRLVLVQPVRRDGHGAMAADGALVEPTDGEVRRPPGRRRRRWAPAWPGGTRSAVVVAAVIGVLLLGVLAAVTLTRLDRAGSVAGSGVVAAPERPGAGPAPAPVQPAREQAGPPAAPPEPAPAEPPPAPAEAPAVEPAPAPARGAGDLGLPVPISRPACDGGYAVVVAGSVRPEAYGREVTDALARFPGSSYLLARQSCPSLRARTASGADIYAVYLGPYPEPGTACAARARAGGGSYVRRLDLGMPDRPVRC